VHVTVTVEQGGWLSVPDPEPVPRWWQRIRIGYNAALATLSLTLAGPWGAVLASVRDEESLAGAWVMALVPLTVLAFLDNARRAEAVGADPDLWAPKWRAAAVRFLLWAAVLATVLTLPITTLVYALTGVKPA
jgi:FtsH-binding integral membrane protein